MPVGTSNKSQNDVIRKKGGGGGKKEETEEDAEFKKKQASSQQSTSLPHNDRASLHCNLCLVMLHLKTPASSISYWGAKHQSFVL
eukprot:5231744-Amphidinium_carterae.1